MASSNFDKLGAHLANKSSAEGMLADDLVLARTWLDDAPTHASSGAMASWGTLINNFLEHLSENDSSIIVHSAKADYMRLGSYLKAMQTLDPLIWWELGSRNSVWGVGTPGVHTQTVSKPVYNVYNAFYDVCKCLDAAGLNESDRLLQQLVEHGAWDPTELLIALNTMQPQQVADARAGYYWSDVRVVGIKYTAQGKLLRALRPLVLDTAWRPQDTPLYGDMWLAHDDRNQDGRLIQVQRSNEFVQLCAASMPSQTDKLLAFMLSSTDIRMQEMNDAFPLHLSDCKAHETLDALVGILTDNGSAHALEKAERIEFLLDTHHPDIMSLLRMHLSIFPGADKTSSMAEVLVSSFDTLRGRGSVLIMDVTSDVFDGNDLLDTHP